MIIFFFSIEGNYTLKGTMHGSNAGIMSVQIDPQVISYYLSACHLHGCVIRCIIFFQEGVVRIFQSLTMVTVMAHNECLEKVNNYKVFRERERNEQVIHLLRVGPHSEKRLENVQAAG